MNVSRALYYGILPFKVLYEIFEFVFDVFLALVLGVMVLGAILLRGSSPSSPSAPSATPLKPIATMKVRTVMRF